MMSEFYLELKNKQLMYQMAAPTDTRDGRSSH